MSVNPIDLKDIRLLALDVDGILTDCRIWMGENSEWLRFFSIRDGLGVRRLIEAGYQTAIITASLSNDVRARAKVLGIQYFYEGAHHKEPALEDLKRKSGLREAEIAYMGDDYPDIPIIQRVGFGATVPDAIDAVRASARYITKRPGGNGAVREVCELILDHGALKGKHL